MVQDRSFGTRLFNIANVALMAGLMVVTLYPFWYAIVGSLDAGYDYAKGGAFLWPHVFTWANYRLVLSDPGLIHAFLITVVRTAIVTGFSIFYTAMFAYAFSRRYLRGKKWYAAVGFTSMYLSGGLIPFFVLLTWLHLYNTYWVYILPSLFSFWNVIIFSANFRQIPDELMESAKMDGASEFTIFFRVILPLSKPVLAALSVFTAVGVWNDYQTTLYFTQSAGLQTLQYYILKLVQSTDAVTALQAQNPLVSQTFHISGAATSALTVQLAAMVLSALPMIVMYPFAQRYFVKGVLVGSIKM